MKMIESTTYEDDKGVIKDGFIVPCEFKYETPKAQLIIYDQAEYWIPKSQIVSSEWISAPDDPEADLQYVLTITEWIAEKKGLDS